MNEGPPGGGHETAHDHYLEMKRSCRPLCRGVDRLQPVVGQPYVKKDPVPFLVLKPPVNAPVFMDR